MGKIFVTILPATLDHVASLVSSRTQGGAELTGLLQSCYNCKCQSRCSVLACQFSPECVWRWLVNLWCIDCSLHHRCAASFKHSLINLISGPSEATHTHTHTRTYTYTHTSVGIQNESVAIQQHTIM